MPAAVYGFSGTPPPILSYVGIGRDKNCVPGPAYVGQRGLLGRVQRIHYFLLSRPLGGSIVQYRPLLPAHALRLSLYIGFSRGSHTSSADTHQARCTEPHTLGTTYCLFCARPHVQHDLQSRLTRWENKGVFCRLHNPLPFLVGQPVVMAEGQDQRQFAGHAHAATAGLCLGGLIHQRTLAPPEALSGAGLTSG